MSNLIALLQATVTACATAVVVGIPLRAAGVDTLATVFLTSFLSGLTFGLFFSLQPAPTETPKHGTHPDRST